MLENFLDRYRPNDVKVSVNLVNFAELYEQGYRFVILDVDGTLVRGKEVGVASEIVSCLAKAREQGFIEALCLLSNTVKSTPQRRQRLGLIAAQLHTPLIVSATWPKLKPHPEPFREAIKQMEGADTTNTVVIGDQLFTDIVGGNRLGLYTIYVHPLGGDHPLTKLKRLPERFLLKRWGVRLTSGYLER